MTHSLEDIKRLLAEITPYPWQLDIESDHIYISKNGYVILYYDDLNSENENDAKLIASAPTIIRELVERVERLQSEIDWKYPELRKSNNEKAL